MSSNYRAFQNTNNSKKLFELKNIREAFKQTCRAYNNHESSNLVSSIQILITKIGIAISKMYNGPHISVYYDSLRYLCDSILYSENIKKNLEKVGINKLGNTNKHSISEIDSYNSLIIMYYNNLINALIVKLNLLELRTFIIKNLANPKNRKHINSHYTNEYDGDEYEEDEEEDDEYEEDEFNYDEEEDDEYEDLEYDISENSEISLEASIQDGMGEYEKGFSKRKMINFILNIDITNYECYKITKFFYFIKSDDKLIKKNIAKTDENEISIDLDYEWTKVPIIITVYLEYKIGFLKTKNLHVKLKKNFRN